MCMLRCIAAKKEDVKAEKLEYRETWTMDELNKYNGTTPGKPLCKLPLNSTKESLWMLLLRT